MFEFYRQPLKTIYLTYVGLSTIFFRLPYWTLKCVHPPSRPRKSWNVVKCLAVFMTKHFVKVIFKVGLPEGFSENLDDANASAKYKEMGFTVVPKFPENLLTGEMKDLAARQNVTIDRTFGFWYHRKGTIERRDKLADQDKKVALLFHGEPLVILIFHMDANETDWIPKVAQ